jgi:hypothetical protein
MTLEVVSGKPQARQMVELSELSWNGPSQAVPGQIERLKALKASQSHRDRAGQAVVVEA